MTHLPSLIQDLALILGAAAVASLLFRRLRQPVLLGYILAGFLVGPHFEFLPTIGDVQNIRIWGEIGVVFLLFSLGLEFSFRKLARVGGAASVTAIFEVTTMIAIGYATGKLLGWSEMNSIFLGGILSISSTSIILRAFEETGVKGRGFVNLVFGVLIAEDLIAILLLVLLSTLAVTKSVSGIELIITLAKLSGFLVFFALAGVFLLPPLMNRLRPYLTQETLLVSSLGLCFILVLITAKVGFSIALGAFMMGSLFSETIEGKRIAELITPLKDLFASVFFVSVGTMIDPNTIVEHWLTIVTLATVVLIGKPLSATIGALLSGRSLSQAIPTGLSLAQIGEFSFIIAGLGLTLRVTDAYLYPIAVGVSVLTTFTTPFFIKSSDRVNDLVMRCVPSRWILMLNSYHHGLSSVAFGAEWVSQFKTSWVRLLTSTVLITAIFLGVHEGLMPVLDQLIRDGELLHSLGLVISLVLSCPFFWAIVRGHRRQTESEKADIGKRLGILAVEVSWWLMAILLFIILSSYFVNFGMAVAIAAGLVLVLLLFFSGKVGRVYSVLEERFFINLEHSNKMLHAEKLAPWDAHLSSLQVHPQSAVAGKTLEELRLRERYGVTIALIDRGGRLIPAPGRRQMLFPFDEIFVIGTDDQLMRFRSETEATQHLHHESDLNYSLRSYRVEANSPYLGRSIWESGLREDTMGLVVGIEREQRRILNPDSSSLLLEGDLLWIVGEKEALDRLR